MPECSHPAAFVLGWIGDAGADAPEDRGIPWSTGPYDPVVIDGYDDLRASATLGKCGECGVLVASVGMWDLRQWTLEHGPSWSTGWTPLRRPGERS